MASPPTIDVKVNPTLTLNAQQLANLVSWIQEPPGPRHTAGVDVRQDTLSGVVVASPPYIKVWCSCGWAGDRIELDGHTPVEDIPEPALEELARSWRFHVRLSNRIYTVDKRLRREAARSREEEE